jgi:hypothetical protein
MRFKIRGKPHPFYLEDTKITNIKNVNSWSAFKRDEPVTYISLILSIVPIFMVGFKFIVTPQKKNQFQEIKLQNRKYENDELGCLYVYEYDDGTKEYKVGY